MLQAITAQQASITILLLYSFSGQAQTKQILEQQVYILEKCRWLQNSKLGLFNLKLTLLTTALRSYWYY